MLFTLFWQRPEDIISSGSELLVRFKSDDTLNTKGFYASYVMADPEAHNFDSGKEIDLDADFD